MWIIEICEEIVGERGSPEDVSFRSTTEPLASGFLDVPARVLDGDVNDLKQLLRQSSSATVDVGYAPQQNERLIAF